MWKGVTAVPDERAGPNLVIYFAVDDNTRRTARTIAKKTGGELFDISGKKPLPDLSDYDVFFVGSSVANGHIAAPLANFLARTDFMDGRVIPFWTIFEEADVGSSDNVSMEFERITRGARFLAGGGLLFTGKIKARNVGEAAEVWAETALSGLSSHHAAGGDLAEDMVKLFAAAYNWRFGQVAFQQGDWTLEMDGVIWCYAHGRFLPRKDAGRYENFRPQFLYRYSPEPSANADWMAQWRVMANQVLSRRQPSASYGAYRMTSASGTARSPFYDTIWQSRTREESYSCQRLIKFLGHSVRVHKAIVEPMNRVGTRILAEAKTDTEIPRWLGKLASITGWNWRNIAGSQNRSFHAYGAAVDLLMKAEAGMETYWQWTVAKGIDWRTVPNERRQKPPASVIRAFEEEGFIWGGRWSRYDTMHFEYHPELLILGIGRG
ncbi:MAG: M15 family metallopeptidase [Spirochaetaceae bacterium]|nr:M15 family metallopeptidase [Spirochaetaceae bacterium]